MVGIIYNHPGFHRNPFLLQSADQVYAITKAMIAGITTVASTISGP